MGGRCGVRYGGGDRDHRDTEKMRESEGEYREEVRVRVRKWDVHIHCDQHFQFSVFEILVRFSFDLVLGPME